LAQAALLLKIHEVIRTYKNAQIALVF